MDSKKVIQQLIKIAEKQQKIIEKLAQQLPPDSLPTGQVSMTGGQQAGPAAAPPAQNLDPNKLQHKDPKAAIIAALGAFYSKVLSNLDVRGNDVWLSFKPGQATQANYDHVKNTVAQLQKSNTLMGQSYNVRVQQG